MWKKCLLLGILLAVFGGFFSPLFAQSEGEQGDQKFIYVPQKDWKSVLNEEKKGIQISYQEYLDLLKKQPSSVDKPSKMIIVQDVNYQGNIHSKTLSFWMEMSIVCFSPELTPFEFEFGQLGISEATLDDKPIALFRQDEGISPSDFDFRENKQQALNSEFVSSRSKYKLFLQGAGTYTFRMLCHQEMESKRDEQFTVLELGNFPGQIFRLSSDSHYTYTTTPQHLLSLEEEFLDIFLGDKDRLSLSMRPKEKEDEKKAIEVAQIDVSHLVKVDSVLSRFTVNLEVHHRPLRTFSFVLPAGWDLLSISESRWNLEEKSLEEKSKERVLTVQLEKELLGKHQISLSGEMRLLEDGHFDLPKLEARGENLLRQSGQIYVEKTSDVKVQLDNFTLARQRDLQEVAPIFRKQSRFSKQTRSSLRNERVHRFGQTPFLVMEYWEPQHQVQLEKNKVQMAVESSSVSGVSIYPDGFEMTSDVTFDVTEGEVKLLSLKLPSAWTVTSVKAQVAQGEEHSFRNIVNPSYYIKEGILHLPLEQKLVQKQRCKVLLELKYIPDAWQGDWTKRRLALPAITPINCDYLPSFIGIISDSDYQIKTPLLQNVSSVDLKIIRSLRISSENLALGLKLSSSQSRGVLEITRKTPRVSLVAAHYIRVGTENMNYSTTLAYNIKNASIKRFRFQMDDSFTPVVHIQDENNLIKEKKEIRENNQRIWEIELQKKVMGAYSIHLSSEVPLRGKESHLSYPKMEFSGIDYLKGFFGLESNSHSEVSLQSKNLETIASSSVPVFAHPGFTPQRDFSYSLKYTKTNYSLDLRVGVHEKMDVAQAVLQSVNIATIYSGSGMERVECVYQLNHLGLQFFHLRLPEGADFWSAVVDDKGEKPLVKNNSIAIPVKRRNDGRANEIKVVYQRSTKSLGYSGELKLERPQSEEEIPVRSLSWQVFLPQEYRLTKEFQSGQDRPWYSQVSRWVSFSKFSSSSPEVYKQEIAQGQVSSPKPPSLAPEKSNTYRGNRRMAPKSPAKYDQAPAKNSSALENKSRLDRGKGGKKNLYGSENMPEPIIAEKEATWEGEDTDTSNESFDPMPKTEGPMDLLGDKLEENREHYNTPGNQPFTSTESSSLDDVKSSEDGFFFKDQDSGEWDRKEKEKKVGTLRSDLKPSEKTREAGVEAIKAKGLRSINISLNTGASYQGSKTTSPSTKSLTVGYSHINTQRSLHFFFVLLSTFAGAILLTHFCKNRFTVFMTVLLLITFLPAFLGVWFIPYSNALVLGLFLSVLLNLASWFLEAMGRPLGLSV